jgi:hypothetical protein
MAGYVIPSILEPPTDDDSESEGSLTGSIAAKDRAVSSLAKGPASKGPPRTADCRSGQLSVAVCGLTSAHVGGVAGNPRIQWDETPSRTKSFQLRLARLPRP